MRQAAIGRRYGIEPALHHVDVETVHATMVHGRPGDPGGPALRDLDHGPSGRYPGEVARRVRVLWIVFLPVGGSGRPSSIGVTGVAAVCDVCGKGPGFGMSVSHSHRRTHRRWNPNIQPVRAQVAPGTVRRVNVCTSCLKAGKVTRG